VKKTILFLAFVSGIFSAQAELPDWLAGKAYFDEYESVGPARDARGDGNGTLQSGITLFGTASPKFSDGFSGKAALRGSAFRRSLEKGKSAMVRGEAKELWIARSRGGFDLKVGEIVTPWGRSDAVNPTDFLTAKDLTFLSTSDEIRRRGAPGFRASFVPNEGASPFEVTLAWNARYPQTKMLIPTSGIPAGLAVDTNPSSPDLFRENQEWALKLAYLASDFDFAISAFSGRTHFGQFVWDGSRVGMIFEKEKALGADFSITRNDFVLRGESAYYFYGVGKSGGAGQSLTEPDHWDSVLGLERALGARVRVNAQATYRVHPAQRNPAEYVGVIPADTAINRGIGQANALIQNDQQKSQLGATLLFSYSTEGDEWVAEMSALGNFIGGDFVLRPKLTRKLRDSLHAALGMDYYGGPPGQTLGALRDYRSVYLEALMDF